MAPNTHNKCDMSALEKVEEILAGIGDLQEKIIANDIADQAKLARLKAVEDFVIDSDTFNKKLIKSLLFRGCVLAFVFIAVVYLFFEVQKLAFNTGAITYLT